MPRKAQTYPTRPNFPFVLANGIDTVMIDYSGSMHCDSGHLHLEQTGGAVCCWEKITHRTRERRLVPIAQCPYRIMGPDGELFEVGKFKQNFDPMRARMITTVEACIIRLRITSFLTKNHLYVERHEVLWADPAQIPDMLFIVRKPRYHDLNHHVLFPASYGLRIAATGSSTMKGTYRFDEVRGNLRMAVRTARQTEFRPISDWEAGITVHGLRAGDTIERYISLQDNTDTQTRSTQCITVKS